MADVVYLLRHAAPPEEARGRYWGAGDPGVDPASLAGAADLAGLIRHAPIHCVSSPLVRARLTAEALAKQLAMAVNYDGELAEVDFGKLDGMNFDEIRRDYPEEADAWARLGDHYHFPGGEAVQMFFRRIAGSWKRWRDATQSSVLVVSHAGVIACWMCLFLGLPLSKRFAFRPEYASLTAFVRKKDGSGWNLAFFNNRKLP